MGSVDGCVFCPDNWDNLDIEAAITSIEGNSLAIVTPLHPVVDGHVLVICSEHTQDASADPKIAGVLMRCAAWWVKNKQLQANIVTNVGPAAAQTVFHTHLHVVPRVAGDGVQLPWSKQE